MNQRRSFLRNITLAIAASLLPEILRPVAIEINKPRTVYVRDLGGKDAAPILQALIDDPSVERIELVAKEYFLSEGLMGPSSKKGFVTHIKGHPSALYLSKEQKFVVKNRSLLYGASYMLLAFVIF